MVSYWQWFERAVAAGATDGLPLVPPSAALVDAVLSDLPDGPIGPIPPATVPTSVRAVAEQAVMAGCPPSMFPLLLAALDAALDGPDAVGHGFNLAGVQATANSCAPLIVASGVPDGRGPAVALGRALRLVLWNLGQGRAGRTDMSVTGNPSKLSYALFESARSPFPPLHVERGLRGVSSAVTVFACDGPHHVPLRPGIDGALGSIARSMSALGALTTYWWGGEIAVVLTVALAELLHADGWTPADLRSYLYEAARRTRADLDRAYAPETRQFARWPAWTRLSTDPVPVVRGSDGIHIIVAGDHGPPAAAVLPGWGGAGGFAMTRALPERVPPTLPNTERVPPAFRVPEAVADLELGDDVGLPAVPLPAPVPPAVRADEPIGRLLVVLNHAQRADGADPIDELCRGLAEHRPGLAVTVHVSRTPTEPEDGLGDLVSGHDAVLLATGASGARSYKVVVDAVTAERLGTPTVSLIVDGYQDYAVATAELLGLGRLAHVVVPTGYAGWDADGAVGPVLAELDGVGRG